MKSYTKILVLFFIQSIWLFYQKCPAQEMKILNKQLDSLNNIFNKKNLSSDLKAKSFNDLAEKEYKTNRFSEALYYYKMAAELYENRSKKKEIADIYAKMANILITQFDYEGALEYYFKTREILHEIKDYYRNRK